MTLTYFQGFRCKLRIVFPQTMLYFCHILNHQPLWGRYLVVQRVFKWDLNWQSFDRYHIYCSMIWNDSIFQKFHLFPIVKAMILVISIKKKALWRPKILFNIIIHFWSSKTSSSDITSMSLWVLKMVRLFLCISCCTNASNSCSTKINMISFTNISCGV